MKHKRNNVIAAVLTAVVLSVLTGCGSSVSAGKDDTAGVSERTESEITDDWEQMPFVKAELAIDAHGELRKETLGNREDIERLRELIGRIIPQTDAASGSSESHAGILTLTDQNNNVRTLNIGQQGEISVSGTAWFGILPDGDREELWKLFSTIDGWNRYGGKIRIRMKSGSHTEEEQAISFTLENETGKQIDYILSPIFYKQEGDSWVMLESIAGFCGVTDSMDGDEKELSVPWSGAFEIKGEGTYKLEIQVAPEEGLRFAVSDTFVVKK